MTSGDHDGAEAALNEALALRETLHGVNSAEASLTAGSLGEMSYARGDYSRAEALFQRKLTTLRRLGPGHEEAISDSLNDLAMTIQQTRSDYTRAQECLPRVSSQGIRAAVAQVHSRGVAAPPVALGGLTSKPQMSFGIGVDGIRTPRS